jgi:hypothetical protein
MFAVHVKCTRLSTNNNTSHLNIISIINTNNIISIPRHTFVQLVPQVRLYIGSGKIISVYIHNLICRMRTDTRGGGGEKSVREWETKIRRRNVNEALLLSSNIFSFQQHGQKAYIRHYRKITSMYETMTLQALYSFFTTKFSNALSSYPVSYIDCRKTKGFLVSC